MNKGFATILVTVAFFVAAALMMGMQQQTPPSASFKESFSASAVFITNYENLLNQASQDCNWTLSDANKRACVETNSNSIFGLTKSIIPPYTTCFTTNTTSVNSYTVSLDLNCTTSVDTTKGTLFYNNFGKKIVVKK